MRLPVVNSIELLWGEYDFENLAPIYRMILNHADDEQGANVMN